MELPSQSGLCSPRYTESEEEDSSPTRSQLRKSNKPLLEKKRRARINSSLEQLKSLVLDALKKDSARYSKLEKADILEMTVKHLKELQRHQMAAAMTVDPTVVSKYQDGFSVCAQEVQRYLGSIDGLNNETHLRLMNHLGNCMNQTQQVTSYAHVPAYGVPCASPAPNLPGLAMRAALPFGGLAMTSPESPTLPMMTSPSMYNVTDDAFTPKYHQHERSQQSLKRENSENIAPARALSEKTNNTNQMNISRLGSRDYGDNNNNVCPPLAKRQKVDIQREHSVHRNNNITNRNIINQNLLELQIKAEPVWRPW